MYYDSHSIDHTIGAVCKQKLLRYVSAYALCGHFAGCTTWFTVRIYYYSYLEAEHMHKRGTALPSGWNTDLPSETPQQVNNDDCGVHMCALAESLMGGKVRLHLFKSTAQLTSAHCYKCLPFLSHYVVLGRQWHSLLLTSRLTVATWLTALSASDSSIDDVYLYNYMCTRSKLLCTCYILAFVCVYLYYSYA